MANRYLGNIYKNIGDHCTFGVPKDDGTPCIMIDGDEYHYVIFEKVCEIEKRTTKDVNLLMYWIVKDVVSGIAHRYSVKYPMKGLAQQRVVLIRQIEVMQMIDEAFQEKLRQDIWFTLGGNDPFSDGLPLGSCPERCLRSFNKYSCPCRHDVRIHPFAYRLFRAMRTFIQRMLTVLKTRCLKAKSKQNEKQISVPRLPETNLDETSCPGISSFGYKNLWFAVRSTEPVKVAHALGIVSPQEVDWNDGVEASYQNSVFITPPIDGWVLAVGWGLLAAGATDEAQMETARRLSEEFCEVQYFRTHRITEAHCWIRAIAGKVVRAYSYVGDCGETLLAEGEPTDVEQNWNLFNSLSAEAADDGYFEQAMHPDEDTVMTVAASWSINPSELSAREDIPAKGLLGKSGG